MDKLRWYGKECFFYYRKNIKTSILIVLLTVVLFTLTGSIISLTNTLLYESDLMKKTYDGKVFYQLLDGYVEGGDFAEFVQSTDSLGKLKGFYNGLSEEKAFRYLTICDQSVETDNGATKAVQVDQSFCDFYELPISEGRGFLNSDFMDEGNKMPVLLGAEYEDQLNLGETFTINYYQKEFDAVVVGILEPNTKVYHLYTSEYYLDDQIIMPFKRWGVPETLEEEQFQIIQYFSMVNGYVVTGDAPEEGRAMMGKVETISEQSGFQKYLFIGLSPFMVKYKWLLNALQENAALVYRIMVLAIVLNGAMMGILVYMQQRKQIAGLAMQMVMGCRFREIFKIKILSFTGIIGFAYGLYLCVSEQCTHTGSIKGYAFLFMLSVFMVIYFSILSTVMLWKNPPSTYLASE